MERVILSLVAMWLIPGLIVRYVVGRIGANKGRGLLPPPENFAETLARL